MLSVQVQVPVGNLNPSIIISTEVDPNPIFKALKIGSVKKKLKFDFTQM